MDVLIKWEGYEDPSWEPMEMIKKDDPITLAKCAQENQLLDQSIWNWAKCYVKKERKLKRLY